MEALIFGLVIMAISAFFGKDKKKSADDSPARPVSTSASTRADSRSGQKTFKRVEDYAKEIYGELQSQKTQRPERVEQAKKKLEQAVDRMPLEETRQEMSKRMALEEKSKDLHGRISSSVSKPMRNQPVSKVEKDQDVLLPLSDEDVRRGIIMAEILLPPKSKR